MSTSLLGDYFDLHGGGMDLKFPHHENELAQSCAACGSPFVRFWMHNGFVRVDDEKMSKSLGNFFTVREVLRTLRDPEVLRFFLLSSHYSGPINYSAAQLAQADETLLGLYRALADTPAAATPGEFVDGDGQMVGQSEAVHAFTAAMDDDFNTPDAFAVMQGVARELNTAKSRGDAGGVAVAAATLRSLGAVLGILQQEPDLYLKRGIGADEGEDAAIQALVDQRCTARSNKDFAESDRIRSQLTKRGVVIEDKPGGITQWRRA